MPSGSTRPPVWRTPESAVSGVDADTALQSRGTDRARIGWHLDPVHPDFARFRQELLERGLRAEVAVDRDEVRSSEARRREIEHCGTPQAAPACEVQVRSIYQILRAFPPEQVFAQTLLGFETIQASAGASGKTQPGDFVGINFVQPEDSYLSMRDYTLQMKMLDYLHSVYPTVHISLHAGELAPGWCLPTACASIFGRRWTWAMPSASVTEWM